jgi:DNA-binding transcriptional MerR regulator
MVPWRQRLPLLSIDEVAARCGLHPALIERLVGLGLIDPEEGCGDLFRPEVTLRIQRLLRLRRDLGINYNAVALVLDLLERIDMLEARLRHFEALRIDDDTRS